MRDAKTGSDASSERIMAELNIDPNAANLANESLVLKSTALMNKVVEDLNLNTSYWQKKDFRELDLYHATPLLVHFEQIDKQRACTLHITPLDEKRFTLGHPNDQGELILLEGFYGTAYASLCHHLRPSHLPDDRRMERKSRHRKTLSRS